MLTIRAPPLAPQFPEVDAMLPSLRPYGHCIGPRFGKRKGDHMSEQATGTYTVTSWDEKTWDGKPWNEVPGSKVTHSIVTQTFTGGIEGTASCQQLVAYSSDTYASFVGLHQVTGSV